ncbi:MAG: mandelate racemase/muconate lactonizing enzyme family protein [Peptococcaceae bacterium]|jgi:galactonate dehydratase|nr:mandelate racemase/muconate lactonizing enzyme family protein [Peptococcaceae bacterium]
MKITDIKQYVYSPDGRRNLHFVKVETDEDIFGFAECTLRVKLPLVMEGIKLLTPHMVGLSIFDIEAWVNKFYTHDRWRGGVAMNTAIAGVEMAVYDAIGKKLKMPVYNLLGGKMSDRVACYASGPWAAQPEYGDSPAERAKTMVKMGFKGLKMDPLPWVSFKADHPDYDLVTKADMYKAVENVGAVYDAIGDSASILIEGHGRTDYIQAIWLAKEYEQFKIGFFEEPVEADDWDGYKKLALKANVPLAAGERLFTRWGHRRIYESGFLSIVQPDFTHCCGLLESKKMVAMAEAYYMKFAPHNSSGPSASMAAAMVDATMPNFYMQEFVVDNIPLSQKMYKDGIPFEDGAILLDDGRYGLGLDPNWEEIESHLSANIYDKLGW